ncbi:hypothetical protein Dimus_036554, partial [Dionaea muscipula]
SVKRQQAVGWCLPPRWLGTVVERRCGSRPVGVVLLGDDGVSGEGRWWSVNERRGGRRPPPSPRRRCGQGGGGRLVAIDDEEWRCSGRRR